MTVRQWVTEHVHEAPRSLVDGMLAALGTDAEQPAGRTHAVCLSAAARALDALVERRAFAREHALDLLVIDALATLAYEHAAETATSVDALDVMAERGAQRFGESHARV